MYTYDMHVHVHVLDNFHSFGKLLEEQTFTVGLYRSLYTPVHVQHACTCICTLHIAVANFHSFGKLLEQQTSTVDLYCSMHNMHVHVEVPAFIVYSKLVVHVHVGCTVHLQLHIAHIHCTVYMYCT